MSAFIKRHLAHFYALVVLLIADFFFFGTLLPWLLNGDTPSMAIGLFGSVAVSSISIIAVVALVQSFSENHDEQSKPSRTQSRRPRDKRVH